MGWINLGILAAIALAASPDPAAAKCDLLVQPNPSGPSHRRGVAPEDLATIRDIGPPTIEDYRLGIYSLSPDKTKIAFQIRQASPASNDYCLGMFVLNLAPGAVPVQVDQGGEFLGLTASAWNFAVLPSPGIPQTITPAWTSDGKWIAYLRRDNGTTQVWKARVDGTGSEQVTNLPFDVEGFYWSADGQAVIVRGRPGLTAFDERLAQEARSGYHYDQRILPSVSTRPIPLEPIAMEYFTIRVGSREVRPATDDEKRLADPAAPTPSISGADWIAQGSAGSVIWAAPTKNDDISAPTALHIRRNGEEIICAEQICQETVDGWFETSSDTVIYTTRSKVTGDQSFYRWPKGAKAPKIVLRTENLFTSCNLVRDSLLCGEEELSNPRRLVEIKTTGGQMRVLFDPNPGFGQLIKGHVQRLHWTTSYGLKIYGDLVLPPDHIAGQKHPLIIVGYGQRGFLRGGTGDEYPIFALAEKGYAVLSYHAPEDIGFIKGAKTWAELERIDRVDWLNFRSAAASVEQGLDTAISTEVVDEAKVGLTGFSYGASIAQFELVNSTRFSAAILSTCCEEGSNGTMFAGPGFSKTVHAMGYPGLTEDGSAFWKPMSFRMNAKTMRTPTLFQVASREFLNTIEGVTALSEFGQPVDEFIFPDESHIKWQPVHRLAVYRRGIQWFDFWLRGIEASDPVQTDQYEHWRSLRQSKPDTSGGSPGP